jgi:hypothetical protein
MLGKVPILSKTSSTNQAPIRLFSSMNPLVIKQIPSFLKDLVTAIEGAFEHPSFSSCVVVVLVKDLKFFVVLRG